MTDITIAGMGLRAVDQVTRETEAAIRRSREVLYADTGAGTAEYLAERCPKVTSLYAASYGESGNRVHAYHHMAAAVIDAALRNPPVTFLLHGHPLVFVYAPFLVRDMAGLLGLTVEVLPGISSMAALFAELWIDPGVNGIQMYEATDLLLRRRQLQPDVPALIWQVGNLESRLHTAHVSRPERFERFTRYLLQRYPPDHPFTALYGSPHPLVPTTRHTFALRDLPAHAPVLHVGTTLYVPPCTVPPVASDPSTE